MPYVRSPAAHWPPAAYCAVGWPSIFGRCGSAGVAVLALLLRLVGKLDRQALGDVRRHLRHDVRHGPRIDLRRHFQQAHSGRAR